MSKFFEGWYYKHQKGDKFIAVIPGRSSDEAFIQVITDTASYNVSYPLSSYKKSTFIEVGKSRFTRDRIILDIEDESLSLKGSFRYKNMTPISSDIMGPFKYFPMECRHSVVSMNHDIWGVINLNGQTIDFDGGKGYIEGDCGRSFPESYTWIQSNDFKEPCSIMISIAKIPFIGMKFLGCISIVHLGGKEYRLATYKGVKVREKGPGRLELVQGKYRLVVDLPDVEGHSLYAPEKGAMKRIIKENPSCKASFSFFENNQKLFEETSNSTSCEFVK